MLRLQEAAFMKAQLDELSPAFCQKLMRIYTTKDNSKARVPTKINNPLAHSVATNQA
jgi:hypothetical protein